MATTQSAYDWLRSRIAASAHGEAVPARERDARAEIDRLRGSLASILRGTAGMTRPEKVDAALEVSARLQVINANLDACNPPRDAHLSRSLVKFADRRLIGHADAIERGMRYTGDSTIRVLRGD